MSLALIVDDINVSLECTTDKLIPGSLSAQKITYQKS